MRIESVVRRRPRGESEVLTLAEAAAFLKVSERTLWNQAKDGRVPCHRVGSQYRFLTSKLRGLLGEGEEVSQ